MAWFGSGSARTARTISLGKDIGETTATIAAVDPQPGSSIQHLGFLSTISYLSRRPAREDFRSSRGEGGSALRELLVYHLDLLIDHLSDKQIDATPTAPQLQRRWVHPVHAARLRR
jgi:hypothetical protein